MNIIRKFDVFASNFNFGTEGKEPSRKTIIGGLVTMIIYSAGLLYFIYLMYIWQDGQINPTVTVNPNKLVCKNIKS
jgi:hypothetical protein